MAIITGNTPIENHLLAGREVYFKREDQNPSGSFKDRLISYLWPQLEASTAREIVLSSSGNLAISLLHFQLHHASAAVTPKHVRIFVKDNLPETKLAKLRQLAEAAGAETVYSKRPKSDCFKYAQQDGVFWLRNSQGEDYPKAYAPLVDEIIGYQAEQAIKFDGIFVCCSSGTATQGIAERLIERGERIPVFPVQTTRVHPLAKNYDTDFASESETKANAISDKVMPRKTAVKAAVDQLGGVGLICSNAEILAALELLCATLTPSNISEFTGNAALSLAGFFKSQKKSYNLLRPLIIISGN